MFGNPDTYPSGPALVERARSIDVARLLREGPGAPGGPTMFYAESRDFIGWLDRSRGREPFIVAAGQECSVIRAGRVLEAGPELAAP